MKTIKILGTGCPNCKKTEQIVRNLVEELNCDMTIEKVEDIEDIMAYDVMSTPAIVIDEKVKIKGHVPSQDEVRKLLKEVCCDDTNDACCESTDESSEDCCKEGETIPSPCCSETDEKQTDNCC